MGCDVVAGGEEDEDVMIEMGVVWKKLTAKKRRKDRAKRYYSRSMNLVRINEHR